MSQISPQKTPISSSPSPNTHFLIKLASWLHAFWKFSRPHTVVGTTLSIFGLSLIAIATPSTVPATPATDLGLPPVVAILLTLLACLGGNVYIVGLNQLEDVEIDRINKPQLPLASGEFSRRQGWVIVAIAGLMAIAIALTQGRFLTATVGLSLLIGTAYSLPPMRLKRFPFWASLCIFSVRGVIVNLGLFLHIQDKLGASPYIPPTVWTLTLFILVFTWAIALLKDIPDLEGDRLYQISTFALRLGQRTVFRLTRGVLALCYVAMMAAGLAIPTLNPWIMILAHGLALLALWLQSRRVDFADKSTVTRFYQFIWKLFFLEYLMFPLACFLRS